MEAEAERTGPFGKQSCGWCRFFKFWISGLSRISDFGFRIPAVPQPSAFRACLKNGWNGLPARFWGQPAAKRPGGLVARRNRPVACSTQKTVFRQALSRPALSHCSLVLWALLGINVIGALSPAAAAAPRQPNVLFIAVDDMNNDLGCYGHLMVKSPNIDRLARMGVKFDRAYCQFPLCSPSRSSLMTGLRPSQTRVFNLQYHFRTGLPDVVTLSQLFKNNGYFAARVGKIYHYGNPGQIGTSGLDDPPSWSQVINPAGRDKTVIETNILNYTPKRGLGSAMCYLPDAEGRDEDHTDGKVALETIKLLEAHRDKPFFIATGFYKPHTPYVAPKKYFDLYPLDSIKLPAIPADEQARAPKPALASNAPWPYFGVTEDQARECKRAYYATISFVDAQIGKVLEAMDRLQLWDNTIVVFWSDHGYHLGEHGLWMKQSLFEESARVPLIIVAPGTKARGKTSPRVVEFVDLYPTLADLAELTPPANLAGASLRPLLNNPIRRWNRPAFTQVQRGQFPGYSVRTERWRYIEWDDGAKGTQLYDHRTDPRELNNLAANPKYAKTVAEMKALIKRNWPVRVEGGRAPDARKPGA
ncbi:MAG: sulfatase [Verrucomicrobia bacterium]|nr:sulfatase [Verrucomicrobiota bacterium]